MMKKLLLIATLAASAAFAQPPAKKPPAQPAAKQKVQEETTPQIDPVCGMTVEPKTADGKYAYKGKMYYFCSKDDEQSFEKSPDQYVEKIKK